MQSEEDNDESTITKRKTVIVSPKSDKKKLAIITNDSTENGSKKNIEERQQSSKRKSAKMVQGSADSDDEIDAEKVFSISSDEKKKRRTTKCSTEQNNKEITASPPNRYSTRGVRLNFSELVKGKASVVKKEAEIGDKLLTEKGRSGGKVIDKPSKRNGSLKEEVKVEISPQKDLEKDVVFIHNLDSNIPDISSGAHHDDDIEDHDGETGHNDDDAGNNVSSDDGNSEGEIGETIHGNVTPGNTKFSEYSNSAIVPEVILVTKKRKHEVMIKEELSDEEHVEDEENHEKDESEGIAHDEEYKGSRAKRKKSGRKLQYQSCKQWKKMRRQQHQCRHCECACESFSDMTAHISECHPDAQEFRCDVCERKFVKSAHLELHLQQKHQPFPFDASVTYKCSSCPMKFKSQLALTTHTENKHLSSSSNRKKIEGAERIEFHICEICGKKFRTKSHMVVHKQAVHQNKQEFMCNLCPKSFSHMRYLQSHIKRHNSVQRFRCATCGVTYKDLNTLKVHRDTHKPLEDRDYRFICSYCGKKFFSKSGFHEHQNKHTGDKPFQCHECGMSFAHRSTLEKHKLFVHTTERPFKCTNCHKAFKLQRLLDQHLTTHTKQSDFTCNYCHRSYSCKNSLKQHGKKCKVLMQQENMADVNIITLTADRQGFSMKKKENSFLKFNERIQVFIPPNSNMNSNVSDNKTLVIDTRESDIANIPQKKIITVSTPQNEQKEIQVELDGVDIHIDQVVEEMTCDVIEHPANQNEAAGHVMKEDIDAIVQNESDSSASVPAGEVYMCSVCNANFDDLASAEHHILTAHGAVEESHDVEYAIMN